MSSENLNMITNLTHMKKSFILSPSDRDAPARSNENSRTPSFHLPAETRKNQVFK